MRRANNREEKRGQPQAAVMRAESRDNQRRNKHFQLTGEVLGSMKWH